MIVLILEMNNEDDEREIGDRIDQSITSDRLIGTSRETFWQSRGYGRKLGGASTVNWHRSAILPSLPG